MSESEAIKLELVKSGLSLILLLTGWIIGQRIVATWDLRKKRQELDVAAAVVFQQLYGELKEVGRLWREFARQGSDKLSPPPDIRWILLARAAAAESKYEAVVIKLASERLLSTPQRKTLGQFRQGCQQLRQSIRNGMSVGWSRFGDEYHLFNDLATEVTCMIAEVRHVDAILPSIARRNLEAIAAVRTNDWEAKVAEYKRHFAEEPLGPSSSTVTTPNPALQPIGFADG